MNGILVRVGVDQAYGHWNAPVDPVSRKFVYIPIPEKVGTPFKPGLNRSFREILPALGRFAAEVICHSCVPPPGLLRRSMHLDPDFEWLTYGDNGDKRGAGIKRLGSADLVAFYAGLRSIQNTERLVYALVGLYVVEEIVLAR